MEPVAVPDRRIRICVAKKPERSRRGDSIEEKTWVSKKQRSAVAFVRKEIDWGVVVAAIAPSFPIVREQNGNKGHEEEEEEKVRPCEFPVTIYSLDNDYAMRQADNPYPTQNVEKPWIERSHHVDAACIGGIDILNNNGDGGHQVTNSHQGMNTTSPCPSDGYASLTSGLRCLGVTRVTPVLAKKLTRTDADPAQARLQFSPKEFTASPLWSSMLGSEEHDLVCSKEGLELKALDRHGRCYDMILGFARLSTGVTYRLRRGWTSFLRHSGVREGDLVEVGAFRVHGSSQLMLTLLNYALDGATIPEEMDAAEGLMMLSDSKDILDGANISEEMDATHGLMMLSDSRYDTTTV